VARLRHGFREHLRGQERAHVVERENVLNAVKREVEEGAAGIFDERRGGFDGFLLRGGVGVVAARAVDEADGFEGFAV
jgi:hypothetical protein